MEPKDVWTYKFKTEEIAKTAYTEITNTHGKVADLEKEKVTITAESPTISNAAKIAEKHGGRMVGPQMSWG